MAGLDTMQELHWLLGIIHHVDVGIVVVDRGYRVRLWNDFMENHSSRSSQEVVGKELFATFPELPRDWLQQRIDTVFTLNNRAFSTWQQRPYLFRFKSYRPITGPSEWMYQNVTLFPLKSVSGTIDHLCIVIYDVTETALDEQALDTANRELTRLNRSDLLTGLYNRQAWEELLVAEYKRHLRHGRPSTLLLVELQGLAALNQRHGLAAGDAALRWLAEQIVQCKRDSDIVGRYGSARFALLLPECDLQGGMRLAERLQGAVAQAGVSYQGTTLPCSIVHAVEPLQGDNIGYNLWLDRAEQALKQAKMSQRGATAADH